MINGEVDHHAMLDVLLCTLEDERSKQLEETQEELKAVKSSLSRRPLEFTVGQYNILAGYMGDLAA